MKYFIRCAMKDAILQKLLLVHQFAHYTHLAVLLLLQPNCTILTLQKLARGTNPAIYNG